MKIRSCYIRSSVVVVVLTMFGAVRAGAIDDFQLKVASDRGIVAAMLVSQGSGVEPVERPISRKDIFDISSARLHASLVQGIVQVSGVEISNFRSGSDIKISVIWFDYGSKMVADVRALHLKKLSGYFRNSKILTRFSYRLIGSVLIVGFTENSGSEDAVKSLGSVLDRMEAESAFK